GLIRPVLSLDWNTHSRFTTAGFLYTLRHHGSLARRGHSVLSGEGGVLQVARDVARFEKQQRIVEEFALPPDLLRTLDVEQASGLAGAPVAGPGWWFPHAAWADPGSMCRANLAACGPDLNAAYGVTARKIEQYENEWQVLDANGQVIARAPVLVLANAHAVTSFAPAQWLPLRPVRGQISLVPERAGHPLRIAVCREGYVTPAHDGTHYLGASFNEGMPDTEERVEDHQANLQRLEKMLPGFGSGLDAAALRGRVAFRTMALDRLPVLGGMDQTGLYACLGLGSRGMTWSALAAELVASQITGDPLPLERDLVAALAPQRFRQPSANQD
ncbi:MAG TPA: FAD-dependent 5-carboxymethylaminomethyl-2-thiouridine(34) oxidoreductase MnmC, partial [Burkholderiales bacterium]